MATFTGTLKEFEKYIGPRLRNVVQTSIARKLRKDVGKCEMCNTQKDLQAAHIHGTERKTLIKLALGEFCINDKVNDVDIVFLERKFKELHNPPEKIFKILCRKCHNEYDNVKEIITIKEDNIVNTDSKTTKNTLLPIEFLPEDLSEFKELLLLRKSALMTVSYNGGNKEVKEWNASNITEKSDIIGNVRSRLEFRQGNWQNSNINSVKIEINTIDIL